MNDYEMEELIPIVAKLTERYTSKESTSVTYEQARQLMGAVIYCIQQCQGENNVSIADRMPAKDAYAYGYEAVLSKIKLAQQAYNEMIVDFDAYENENYNDTVTKAIPVFFLYYDADFAPQETIITMDYPTICPVNHLSGISAIEKYIEYISLEQLFLGALPKDFIIQVLTNYQASYRKQFYNICRIILRHILLHMIIGKKLGTELVAQDYEKLHKLIQSMGIENLKNTLTEVLNKLIEHNYQGDSSLFNYLRGDIEDFAVELKSSLFKTKPSK